ncbi:helix-turn-helix domain-containing protein [Streptomyces sp. NPDC088348]|uniref:helix-turn-helix domain-containing protein n=1 Tax=Streptomyces sp. NPDC088348 TaxID=3365853 RepID=UPI0038085CB1
MKVRADIAALIYDGRSNASIVCQLGCNCDTVNRVRQALRLPGTPLERLYAEAVPTGQVREYRPQRMPTAPAQAKANQAALLAALRERPATAA